MRSRPVIPLTVATLALGAWCGFASGFRQSSTPAFVTWSVSLAAVVAADLLLWGSRHQRQFGFRLRPAPAHWPRPGGAGKGRTFAGIAPWLVLGLVTLAWELLGIDTGPNEPHLTISALAQTYRPLNAVLLLVWILVGFGYGAARARAPRHGPASDAGDGTKKGGALSAIAVVVVGRATPMPALLLPRNRPVGIAFWLFAVVAGVLVDLVARRSRGRVANAAELVRLISGPTFAHIFLVVAWTFAGWHLFAH